jgi:hypothetical protein
MASVDARLHRKVETRRSLRAGNADASPMSVATSATSASNRPNTTGCGWLVRAAEERRRGNVAMFKV